VAGGNRRGKPAPQGGGIDATEFRRLIDEAKERHNISDVVGRHTKLKKRGGREMVGLCPFHSEKSPSFEVNDGKGTYHCWGCGAGGDAMSFLMKKDGLSFTEAYRSLTGDDFPVVSEEERAKRKAEDAQALAQRVSIAREIWSRGVPPIGTPAEVYARSRGITMALPDTVRFVMAPRWRDAETGEVGRDYPAMACALQNDTGLLVGVQCVFLADGGRRKYERVRDDGTKAKAKLSFGTIVGSAFWASDWNLLSRHEDTPPVGEVIVCEGPEDGLSLAQEMPGRAVLVACGTALMPQLALIPTVRNVVLAGDNNAAGRAAVETTRAAFIDRGLAVRTMYPKPDFKDWNDQLRGISA
jgi:DNA primase